MRRDSGRTCLVAFALTVLLAGSAFGSELVEQVRTYDMTVQLEDGEIAMVCRRSWTKVEEEGLDAWRVTIEYESNDLPPSVDTIYLVREDLRPLRQYIAQSNARTRLRYTQDAVRGNVWLQDGSEVPIDAALDLPIVGDVVTAIATLPLEPNYRTLLNAFDPRRASVRRWIILVSGVTEVIETPLGPIDTYPIELSNADAVGQSALYWVTRQAPHHLVKSESELPADFGGGLETMTIKSVSALPSTAPAGGQ